MLSLGIQGKKKLWRALASVQPVPPLRDLDLRTLEARADEQHEEVEAMRLDAFRRMLQG